MMSKVIGRRGFGGNQSPPASDASEDEGRQIEVATGFGMLAS